MDIKIILMLIIGYLLGSIPSGVWIGKIFGRFNEIGHLVKIFTIMFVIKSKQIGVPVMAQWKQI